MPTNPENNSENRIDLGTSETTREAGKNFDFSAYLPFQPEHIKDIDVPFLVWFIGFFEGDGSLHARPTTDNPLLMRAQVEIDQEVSNAPLMHKIRRTLGFGIVSVIEKEGQNSICRWTVGNQENIIRIIHIFNGNLVLQKRQEQFTQFLNVLNQAWNLNIKPLPFGCKVSLNHGWLSGFSDAEAGFYTNYHNNFQKTASKGQRVHPFVLKYYLTQKGEIDMLNHLKGLLGLTNKITQRTNGYTQVRYNCLEATSQQVTGVLFLYFQQFPVKGTKRIDAFRWARVYRWKQEQRKITQEAA